MRPACQAHQLHHSSPSLLPTLTLLQICSTVGRILRSSRVDQSEACNALPRGARLWRLLLPPRSCRRQQALSVRLQSRPSQAKARYRQRSRPTARRTHRKVRLALSRVDCILAISLVCVAELSPFGFRSPLHRTRPCPQS
jgi:hypothetical protein